MFFHDLILHYWRSVYLNCQGVVLKGGYKPSGEVSKTLATSMSDASTCVTCEGLTAPFSPLIILDVALKSSAFIL